MSGSSLVYGNTGALDPSVLGYLLFVAGLLVVMFCGAEVGSLTVFWDLGEPSEREFGELRAVEGE
jgi:hypothetical protein